jgi:ferric-dicitrate binding protein FerR (iron transport regulator)
LQRPPEAPETEIQAAAWLVRLEADVSAAPLAQWRQWLSEDTRHHVAYVRIETSWRQTDCLARLRPLDGTVDPDVLATFPGLQLPAPPQPAFRPKLAHLAVAAFVATATMVLALWLHLAKPDLGLRRTDLGGFERTTLPDGSTVLLNTNSRQFVLLDPSLATLRVGGSFAATDPAAFSEALQRVFGVRALSVQDSSGAPAIGLVLPVSAATH